MTGVLLRGYLDRHLQRADGVKTQGKGSQPQAKEKGLEHILPSQLLEGTNTADTFILDPKTPELWEIIAVVKSTGSVAAWADGYSDYSKFPFQCI